MKHEAFLIVFAALAILVLLPNSCEAQSALPGKGDQWVGTWVSAPQLVEPGNMPPPPGMADTTLRQVVHVTLGGKWIRVKFSNSFGGAPLSIKSAHVALFAGGAAIKPESDKALAFSGQPSITIPVGELVISDPIPFDLAPLSDLVVTIHVIDPTRAITGHPGARCTSYLLAGDHVSDANLPGAATTEHWYYLSGVDVVAKKSARVVAILGDSITDGRNSFENGNGRWPDNLARRLQADRKTRNVAVLNQGIGGNCVIRGGLGPTALSRLDRDIFSQSGVHWLVVFEGINDLGSHFTHAQDLIAAFQQIITKAHAQGLKVYGVTITPCGGSFYYSPQLEADRQAINTWIRTSGQYDAVIDFDAVARDPQNPSHLLASVDGGDHLHPSNEGYKILANSIDLKLFEK
jgi:lysophospholipase L1-like esterase